MLHRYHYAEQPTLWDVAWGAGLGDAASGAAISCGSARAYISPFRSSWSFLLMGIPFCLAFELVKVRPTFFVYRSGVFLSCQT